MRISSIDIFRALIMLLMIFVNDLWTLHNIPAWLEHKKAFEDGMGLADVVFPAFLFIVGLSIPLAIKNRLAKGNSKIRVFLHIISRTFALLVMGFYMVNLETFREDSFYMSIFWEIAMAIAIILIWNNYPEKKAFNRLPSWILQVLGIVILLILAVIYKGGTAENPQWMHPQWWGILGIIGWSYLMCALLYLLIGDKVFFILLAWIVLNLINVQEFVKIPFIPQFRIITGAAHYSLVMSGVVATVWYIKLKENKNSGLFFLAIILMAGISFIYGYGTRPVWGISKIQATPSWAAVCSGISYIAFLALFLVADKFKFTKWSEIIAPAGRSTLTCYLIPYIVYPLLVFVPALPLFLTGGFTGIIKSILFAFIIILLTKMAEKLNIRLRI